MHIKRLNVWRQKLNCAYIIQCSKVNIILGSLLICHLMFEGVFEKDSENIVKCLTVI